jgi:hypothetical protein
VYDQSCKNMYDEVVQLEPIGLVLLITDDRWCTSNTDGNSTVSGERTEIRPVVGPISTASVLVIGQIVKHEVDSG